MRIALICSGTELLRDKLNSNSILIAGRLSSISHSLSQVTTVGDVARDLESALKDSLNRSEVVLTSGGLGPTFDDLTRECVSKVLKRPLVFSPKILSQIEGRFAKVRRAMPAENRRQAYLVRGAVPILNRVGTAPGQIIPLRKKTLILLPGPPRELLPMVNNHVLRYLKIHYPHQYSRTLVLHVFGYPESEIDEAIDPVVRKEWGSKDVEVIFGILAHRSIIDVKVTAQSRSESSVRMTLNEVRKSLYAILGEKIYGENEDTLESVVGKLLKASKMTLSIAESCTGGLIASKITNIAGSSDYFKEGFVTYSNESKTRLLGVKRITLQKYGSVSEETSREMAEGALKIAKTDWALSVTGIAGPSGGSRQKPVGTVCYGIASRKSIKSSTKIQRYGNRAEIRGRAALTALDILRRELL